MLDIQLKSGCGETPELLHIKPSLACSKPAHLGKA